MILPSFLQAAVDVLESDPGIVLCHARTRIVDGNLDNLAQIDPGAYGTDSPQAWRRFSGRVRAKRCFELYGLIRRESLDGTPLLAPFIPIAYSLPDWHSEAGSISCPRIFS